MIIKNQCLLHESLWMEFQQLLQFYPIKRRDRRTKRRSSHSWYFAHPNADTMLSKKLVDSLDLSWMKTRHVIGICIGTIPLALLLSFLQNCSLISESIISLECINFQGKITCAEILWECKRHSRAIIICFQRLGFYHKKWLISRHSFKRRIQRHLL